jgi:hypothetical protein
MTDRLDFPPSNLPDGMEVLATRKVYADTPEQAFRCVRWLTPDVVRLLRANFDVGSTGKELKRLVKKRLNGPNVGILEACIDHMAANPAAGRIRWLDNGQWDWAGD